MVTKPAALTQHIEQRMTTLQSLPWCVALLREAPRLPVKCYGLGSIFGNRNAQWQFALAVLLARGNTLEVYDPILQLDELAFLNEFFGCSQGAPPDTRVDRPTLFFMPHCPQSVYVSVLKANRIEDVVIVGNSFASYTRRLDVDPLIASLAPAEISCDPGPADPDLERAFNDTSLLRLFR